MKKFNDLIRDINKYADEQVKIHRKVRIWSEGKKPTSPQSCQSWSTLFSEDIQLPSFPSCNWCICPEKYSVQWSPVQYVHMYALFFMHVYVYQPD